MRSSADGSIGFMFGHGRSGSRTAKSFRASSLGAVTSGLGLFSPGQFPSPPVGPTLAGMNFVFYTLDKTSLPFAPERAPGHVGSSNGRVTFGTELGGISPRTRRPGKGFPAERRRPLHSLSASGDDALRSFTYRRMCAIHLHALRNDLSSLNAIRSTLPHPQSHCLL